MSVALFLLGWAVAHWKVGQADRISVYIAGITTGLILGAVLMALPR